MHKLVPTILVEPPLDGSGHHCLAVSPRASRQFTCGTLPCVRNLKSTSLLRLAPENHSGLLSTSPFSHADRMSCPVGNRCYPKRFAVCEEVALSHTFPPVSPQVISPYERRSSGYRMAEMPTAKALVPVEQPGSRHSYVEAVLPHAAKHRIVPAFFWLSYSPWVF